MKTFVLICLLGMAAGLTGFSQTTDKVSGTTDLKSQPAGSEIQTAAPQKSAAQVAVPPKPTDTILKKEVILGGALGDALNAQKARPKPQGPLAVRRLPADNLSYYPNSERPQGFVLFAVKF